MLFSCVDNLCEVFYNIETIHMEAVLQQVVLVRNNIKHYHNIEIMKTIS